MYITILNIMPRTFLNGTNNSDKMIHNTHTQIRIETSVIEKQKTKRILYS